MADDLREANRPYFCLIRPEQVLAYFSQTVGGREVVTHVRIKECASLRDGYGERRVERVRLIELNDAGNPVWQLWEVQPSSGYELVAEGDFSLPYIRIVLSSLASDSETTACIRRSAIWLQWHWNCIAR